MINEIVSSLVNFAAQMLRADQIELIGLVGTYTGRETAACSRGRTGSLSSHLVSLFVAWIARLDCGGGPCKLLVVRASSDTVDWLSTLDVVATRLLSSHLAVVVGAIYFQVCRLHAALNIRPG